MKYKTFSIPIILLVLTILLNRLGSYLILRNGEYDPTVVMLSIIMQLCSFILFFITLIVFAYLLGKNPKKEEINDIEREQNNNWWAIEAPEKNSILQNNGDKARVFGFSSIALSIFAIFLMIILGIIAIISSLGPGLGFSGGTCDSFCEGTWLAASFSGKSSIYLFLIGLISLARPWSWISKSWASEIMTNEEE